MCNDTVSCLGRASVVEEYSAIFLSTCNNKAIIYNKKGAEMTLAFWHPSLSQVPASIHSAHSGPARSGAKAVSTSEY